MTTESDSLRSLRRHVDPIATRETYLVVFYMLLVFGLFLCGLSWYEFGRPHSRDPAFFEIGTLVMSPVFAFLSGHVLLWLTRERVWGRLFRPHDTALAALLQVTEVRELAEAVVRKSVQLYRGGPDEDDAFSNIAADTVLRRALG